MPTTWAGDVLLTSTSILSCTGSLTEFPIVSLDATSDFTGDGEVIAPGNVTLTAVSLLIADATITTPLALWDGGIEQAVEVMGTLSAFHPAPVAPGYIAPLVNPTVAPTLVSSNTGGGALVAGTYRYAYAGWRGRQAQVTAPSPYATIVLTSDDTVTATFPLITDAEGYLLYREKI